MQHLKVQLYPCDVLDVGNASMRLPTYGDLAGSPAKIT